MDKLIAGLLPLLLEKMGYSKDAFDKGIQEAKQAGLEFKERALKSEEALIRIEAKLNQLIEGK